MLSASLFNCDSGFFNTPSSTANAKVHNELCINKSESQECHTNVFACAPDGPDNATIKGPKSAHVGDFTMLYCSTTSVPSATFTWLFNGNPTSFYEAVYVLPSITVSNSGTYTCTAVNAVTGQTRTVTHELTVVGMWQRKEKLTNININEMCVLDEKTLILDKLFFSSDSSGCDCSALVGTATIITAVCCLVIAAVCGTIVFYVVRRKR